MSWNIWGNDPRLDRYMASWTSGLNRWLLRHPVRGPVIFFTIGGTILGLSFIPRMGILAILAIPLLVSALLLLAYAFLRRAAVFSSTESLDSTDEPPDGPIEIDEQARQQAVASWRRRARQDKHQRRNPGG